jgi:hypothetical protein
MEETMRQISKRLTLAALLAVAGSGMQSHAQGLPAPKQVAPAPMAAPAAPAKPVSPMGARAATGPGTQTEDDLYVGVKRTERQVQGVNTPLKAAPSVPPKAGTSPNTGAVAKKNARTGGDDDLEDLEVERRKVQGVTSPKTGTPQPRPSAGTSPNTARGAAPAPALPYKQ